MSKSEIARKFNYDQIADVVLAQKLQNRADEIHAHLSRSVESIVAVGRQLVAARDELPYGTFLEWVDAEFGMKRSTAYNFISVAERFGEDFQQLEKFPARVIYQLAAPGTPDEAVDEVRVRLETGEDLAAADVREIIDEHKGKPEVDALAAVRRVIEEHRRIYTNVELISRKRLLEQSGLDEDALTAACDELVELGELRRSNTKSFPYLRVDPVTLAAAEAVAEEQGERSADGDDARIDEPPADRLPGDDDLAGADHAAGGEETTAAAKQDDDDEPVQRWGVTVDRKPAPDPADYADLIAAAVKALRNHGEGMYFNELRERMGASDPAAANRALTAGVKSGQLVKSTEANYYTLPEFEQRSADTHALLKVRQPLNHVSAAVHNLMNVDAADLAALAAADRASIASHLDAVIEKLDRARQHAAQLADILAAVPSETEAAAP